MDVLLATLAIILISIQYAFHLLSECVVKKSNLDWKPLAMSNICCVPLFADEPIMDVPLLSEGEKANLTCLAPFPCPEAPPEITCWIKTRGGNITDLKGIITLNTSKSLYISTLTLTPTSDLHNATVGCNVSYGSKNISTRRTLEVMCEFTNLHFNYYNCPTIT